MKLFPFIKDTVTAIASKEVEYFDLIQNKKTSSAFIEWELFSKNATLFDKSILNDTTESNPCLTGLVNLSSNTNDVIFHDHFYIQKSLISDLVTFYVKSTIYRISDSNKVSYPPALICYNENIFKEYFDEAWKILSQKYTNLIYVPFRLLSKKLDDETQFKLNSRTYYQVLFGYEGDIVDRHLVIGDTSSSVGL